MCRRYWLRVDSDRRSLIGAFYVRRRHLLVKELKGRTLVPRSKLRLHRVIENQLSRYAEQSETESFLFGCRQILWVVRAVMS